MLFPRAFELLNAPRVVSRIEIAIQVPRRGASAFAGIMADDEAAGCAQITTEEVWL
jgi:hypothetical protein